jgi:hypothetical protein
VFIAGVASSAAIFTWLHLATGRSLWVAIPFHATANFGSSFLATVSTGGTTDRLALCLITAVLAGLLVRLSPHRLRASRRPARPCSGPAAPGTRLSVNRK